MPNQNSFSEAFPRDTLLIHFATESIFNSSNLGSLFTALSADYKRMNPAGELAIARVESGSLRIWLASMFAVGELYTHADKAIDGFNHLYDFGKNVSEIIGRANAGDPVPSGRGQRKGVNSAQAILDTALKSKSSLHIYYRDSNGEQLLVDLPFHRVEHAHQQSKNSSGAKHQKEHGPQSAIEQPRAAAAIIDSRLDAYASRRAEISPSIRAQEDAALVIALELFVETLQGSGSDYIVDTVVQRLEARGLYDVAFMLRQRRGDQKLPQVTKY